MRRAVWHLRFGLVLLGACACFLAVAWLTDSLKYGLAVYAAIGAVYMVLDIRAFMKEPPA